MKPTHAAAIHQTHFLITLFSNQKIKYSAESSIASVAAATPALSTLLAAVKAANLTEKLSDPKLKTTLFAPTNDAFAAYLSANNLTAAQLLASPDLKWILKNHFVKKAAIKSTELTNGAVVKSWLPGANLTIDLSKPGVVAVKSDSGSVAKVTTADVPAGAAIVHLVDAVLVPTPEAIKEAPARSAAWMAKKAASPSAAPRRLAERF